jgi:uncharacterized membrane protein YcaP (DUF421 family)
VTDLGNVFIRGIFGFFFLLILVRLNGKKQITDMTYFEYIAGIAIGGIAAELTFGTEVRASNFIMGMLVWGLLPLMISFIDLKSYHSRLLTEGRPTFLIKNGKILENNLRKERMTVDELMIHLRQSQANVFNISDVETAILETNGQVSVMKKSDLQSLTPKDMGIVVEQEFQRPHILSWRAQARQPLDRILPGSKRPPQWHNRQRRDSKDNHVPLRSESPRPRVERYR